MYIPVCHLSFMIISVLYIYLSYNHLGCSKAKAGAEPTCNLYKIFTNNIMAGKNKDYDANVN